MTRYKGRASPKAIEREFPHIVEMIVPEGGFGKILDAMFDFHARHGIRAINSTGRRDENGRDIIRWCFADRNWLKRSRMSSGRRGEAKTLLQRIGL